MYGGRRNDGFLWALFHKAIVVNAWRARRKDGFLWALFHKARVVNAWRARRNDGFLLAHFHKVVVVNAWRARAYKDVDATCPVCDLEALETFMCRFYECLKAQLTNFGI
jgi:hypothetical protein